MQESAIVTQELLEAGVVNEDIVLGFYRRKQPEYKSLLNTNA
ncbi:MAG TPA: hypothetical protein V6D14_01325 [Coleofasciculaceae cyanobacterium]